MPHLQHAYFIPPRTSELRSNPSESTQSINNSALLSVFEEPY